MLGWLAQAGEGYLPEDAAEPPVRLGLGELEASHHALAEFLRIPDDLLAAASEASAPLAIHEIGLPDIQRWLAERSTAEKDTLLAELIAGAQPHRLAALRQRIERELRPIDATDRPQAARTVGQLLQRAETLGRARREREAAARAAENARKAAEAAAARKGYLASLRGREAALWDKIEELIGHRQASAYQDAVERLNDLRDLAEGDDARESFSERLRRLRDQHGRKAALMRRLDQAGLTG